MSTHAPPKAKRRLGGTALRKLQLRVAYGIAALLAIALGWPFWFWEQRRGRLMDRIENERSASQ